MARKHPNVLKAQKQRRQGRRAYLTSVFSLIKVPRKISTTHIPDDAAALFNYRKRGTTTGMDPFLDAIFPGRTPKASEWKSQFVSKYLDSETGEAIADRADERNGRKFALERSEEEKLLALAEHSDVCEYITMGKESIFQHKRVTFIYNRNYTVCYFIEVFYDDKGTNSYCMKSKVYGGKERAMFDFDHGRITWMEFLPLSSLSLVLPRRG